MSKERGEGRVFEKQREPMKGKDGSGKVGCDHNEHPSMNASFGTVAGFLNKQDDLSMYDLAGSYGKAK